MQDKVVLYRMLLKTSAHTLIDTTEDQFSYTVHKVWPWC